MSRPAGMPINCQQMKDKVCMIDNGNGGIETVRELELRIDCGYLIVSPVILVACSFFRESAVVG